MQAGSESRKVIGRFARSHIIAQVALADCTLCLWSPRGVESQLFGVTVEIRDGKSFNYLIVLIWVLLGN